MFTWKDYGENSTLFLEGIGTNVAILRHKDFRLTDNTTGRNIKINAPDLNEAKKESENFLKDYWNSVYRDLSRIISTMN